MATTAEEHPVAEQTQQQGPTKRGILVLLHGKRAGDEGFEAAVKDLRAEGHEVKVRVTYEAGDVDEFVREALTSPHYKKYQTIVGAGGDGTLNELVAALLKHKAPTSTTVALIPMGTANDFAAANGISQDPVEALRLAARSDNAKHIDVGLVNGQVFMNTAGVGLGCEVDPNELTSPLKRLLGPLAIFIQGWQKIAREGLEPKRGVTLRYPVAPGEEDHAPEGGNVEEYTESALEEVERIQALDKPLSEVIGVGKGDKMRKSEGKLASFSSAEIAETKVREVKVDLLTLLAGNSRQIARTVAACPDALLDDGMLDFTLILGTAGEQVKGIAKDILTKGITNAKGKVDYLRLPWLELRAPEALQINRDGEPEESSDRVVFEVLKRRLRMHLPDDRLLISGQDDPKSASKMGRRMTKGKLRQMLTNVQTAPGRWARVRPRVKYFLFKLLPSTALTLSLGYLAGYKMAKGFTKVTEPRGIKKGGAKIHSHHEQE